MSMLMSKNNNSMGRSLMNEFKRQASFFLRDKINTARLTLTDVTHAQLLTEEVTTGNPWSPDARTMSIISHAAFEVDDFWRITDILHKRLTRFDERNWRMSYNTVILLDHLLTHGPKSTIDEFQEVKDVITEMKHFQFIDAKGFDWGLRVQQLSERVVNLLEDEHFVQEERAKARKVSREIKGFGSLQCSVDGANVDHIELSLKTAYGRWNIHPENESQFSSVFREDDSRATRFEENVKFLINEEGEECSNEEVMNHPFLDNKLLHGAESLLSKKFV